VTVLKVENRQIHNNYIGNNYYAFGEEKYINLRRKMNMYGLIPFIRSHIENKRSKGRLKFYRERSHHRLSV